jgi:hypothetical protein
MTRHAMESDAPLREAPFAARRKVLAQYVGSPLEDCGNYDGENLRTAGDRGVRVN